MSVERPLLSARDVTVRFGGLVALSHMTLDIAVGETVGIIGPNGSGKTTLINALTRLVPVDRRARVTFDGHDLTRCRPHRLGRLGVSRTFQSVEMCTTDSVLRGVVLGATRSPNADRIHRPEAERRAHDLLDVFGIADWAGARTRDIPYGVGKRAQVCRALMTRPKLVLLDEPASGMTATEKNDLADALCRVKQRTETSVVVIEHDVPFLASGLCDRLVALDSGQLVTSGTPDEVRADERVITAYLGAPDDATARTGDKA